jgi:hypothetical protein
MNGGMPALGGHCPSWLEYLEARRQVSDQPGHVYAPLSPSDAFEAMLGLLYDESA